MSKRLSVRSSISKSSTPVKIESSDQPKAICRMLATGEYEPENPDEIAILPDDILNVTEMNVDGDEDWAMGYNTRTNLLGVFPSTFCKLIASTIPKPVKGGKIYECLHSFNPEDEIDEEEERQDYVLMERGDFIELLPDAMQEEFDADDAWVAVRHCMGQNEGLVPMNRMIEVKAQSSSSSVAPRLSVALGKNSSSNSKVRKSIRGMSNLSNLNAGNANDEEDFDDDLIKLPSPLHFKATENQKPEFDEDLSLKVGDILVATDKTADNDAYYGYLKSQPRVQGFFLVDLVVEITKEEAESSDQVKSASAKRASMRKSVRMPASTEIQAEPTKLTPESSNEDMEEVTPYYVVVTQSYTACDAEELTLIKDEVVKVTHSSRAEEGEWVYGLNVKTEQFGLFPLDFTVKSNEHGEKEGNAGVKPSAGVGSEELEKLNQRVTDMAASIEQGDENLRGMRSEVNAQIEEISSKCQEMNVQILGFSSKGDDREEIEAVKEQVSKLKQQIGEFETKFNELDMEDVKSKARSAEEGIGSLEGKVEELQQIKVQMEESEASIQQVKDAQKSIEEQIQIEKESSAAAVSAVNDEIGTVKTELSEIKASIDNNQKDTPAVDSEALEKAVQANEESIRQNSESLETVKTAVANLNDDLESQKVKETINSQKLGEIETKLEEFNSGFEEIKGQAAAVDQKLEEKVQEIDGTTNDLQNKLSELNNAVETSTSKQELNEKLESLEVQVNSLNEKSENFATSQSLNGLDERIKAHDQELIALKDKTESLELGSKASGDNDDDKDNGLNVGIEAIEDLKVQIRNSEKKNQEATEALKEQFNGQSSTIDQMNSRIDVLENQNASGQIEDLDGKVRSNSETCENLRGDFGQVKSEVDELKTRVEEVSKNASEAAASSENKQQRQEPSFDSTELEKKMRQVSTEVQSAQKQAESLGSKITSNDEKMAAKFEELEKRFNAKIEQYDAEIAALKSRQDDESETKKTNNGEQKDSDDLVKKYAKLKEVISKHAKKIVELESKINNLGSSSSGQSVPNDVKDDLKGVKDDLEAVKKDFAEKNQRMSRKVTSMLGQIKQLKGQ